VLESQSQITGVIDARREGHGLIKRCTRQFTGTDGPEGSCNTSAKRARQSSALSNWSCTCFNRTKAHSSRQRSGTNSKASPPQPRWRAGSKNEGRAHRPDTASADQRYPAQRHRDGTSLLRGSLQRLPPRMQAAQAAWR